MKQISIETNGRGAAFVFFALLYVVLLSSAITNSEVSAQEALSSANCEFYVDSNWISADHDGRLTYGLNIESPWENGGTLFLLFPEHLEYNPVGNSILRHWDEIPIPWIISPDGKQASYRVESPYLENVFVESFARIEQGNELPVNAACVKLAMKITNNGSETLPVIRPLLCMQYRGLAGFSKGHLENFENNYIVIDGEMTALSDLSTKNKSATYKGCVVKGCPQHDTRADEKGRGGLIEKEMDLALSVLTSVDDKRKVIIWWTPGKSMIANVNIPCMHADPYFGTLKPGEEASAEGMIIFTNEDVQAIIDYLIEKDKRIF